jgi:hypothetical protein
MRNELARWDIAGYTFGLDWLLRNVTAVATGKAQFSNLEVVSAKEFSTALDLTVSDVDTLLNLLADRLGLDHGRVLISRYAFPVMSRYLHLNSGVFPSLQDRDKLLYWYIHAGLWGRFSGSTESKLAQDYEVLGSKGLNGLIETLAQTRGGSLHVNPSDFTGFGMGSRFYPMLYLLTRVLGAKDFGTGLELKASLLGRLSSLQVHHTFPKKVLYDAGYSRGEVNAVANFVFLTQETNLDLGKIPPAEYMPAIAENLPGVLESQWIPLDRKLWEVDEYTNFLKARRDLLATSANTFLATLLDGSAAQSEALPRAHVIEESEQDPRSALVTQLMLELREHAVVEPLRDWQVDDPETGTPLAVAEAFWPEGLQPGRGEPVLLELDPDDCDIERLQAIGYRVFTSIDSIRDYVSREAAVDAGDSSSGESEVASV